MNNKEFWFKLIKWSTNKPDFCKVVAENADKAIIILSDQLWKDRRIKCDYFSTSGKYNRNIDDIMNFEIVSLAEVKKHINKINYVISNQDERSL